MKARSLLACAVWISVLGMQALAQEQYTEGPVWRVVTVKIKPGRFEAYLSDVRQNIKPVLDQEKSQGLINEYHVFLNPSTAGPEDWNVAIAIQYKSFAALDGLTAKTDPIVKQRYGSIESAQTAAARRAESGEVLSSRLMREITLK